MLSMFPKYEKLSIMQKVELFEHALENSPSLGLLDSR